MFHTYVSHKKLLWIKSHRNCEPGTLTFYWGPHWVAQVPQLVSDSMQARSLLTSEPLLLSYCLFAEMSEPRLFWLPRPRRQTLHVPGSLRQAEVMCTAARTACFVPSEIWSRAWTLECPRHQDTDPPILSACEWARIVLLIPQDIIKSIWETF